MPKPNWAPACEYVAIPLGSSSAAPVIRPGPIFLTQDWSLGPDAGGVGVDEVCICVPQGGANEPSFSRADLKVPYRSPARRLGPVLYHQLRRLYRPSYLIADRLRRKKSTSACRARLAAPLRADGQLGQAWGPSRMVCSGSKGSGAANCCWDVAIPFKSLVQPDESAKVTAGNDDKLDRHPAASNRRVYATFSCETSRGRPPRSRSAAVRPDFRRVERQAPSAGLRISGSTDGSGVVTNQQAGRVNGRSGFRFKNLVGNALMSTKRVGT